MSQLESDYTPYHAETRIGRGRALIFAPHPDDEIFGCCGAILQHLADGDEVRVIVVTDGAFGAGEDGGRYAQTRKEESRAAATVLGYGEPIFWDYPDRGLVSDENLVLLVQTAVTEWQAQIIYAPSWWEIHPDHTALACAVTEAVRRNGEAIQLILYEVAVPLHPNVLLDITTMVERKRAAMACFASQMVQQSYDQHVLALNRYRSYTLLANVQMAEAYRRIDSGLLQQTLILPLMLRVDAGFFPDFRA